MYNLDVKVIEIKPIVEKLRDDAESGDDRPTTDRFQTMPRAQWSSVMPDADTRTTHSAPTATMPPPVSTPPAQQTSVEAFVEVVLSTPSTHTGATS